MVELRYFKPEEFKTALPACSVDQMDVNFLFKLDQCRDIAGIPFHINSAYRSKSYELKHGRSGESAHCLGKAVDIRCISNSQRYDIINAAIAVGFRRIGIYDHFIHLDDATELDGKKSGIIWIDITSPSHSTETLL